MCSALPIKLKLVLSRRCLLLLGEHESTFIDDDLSLSLQQGANVTIATQQDGDAMKLPLWLYFLLKCFCKTFVASAITSFFFFFVLSLTVEMRENITQ